ncbi:hypothetical protein BDA96_01G426400 [Sorghum bicolor]|uniref:Uncharacterized protein n=2 Tax=Sorghum bicolor TaxID=4558 RepID=A0A921S3L7_SORBI|nr:hypothetical protein BDA96_01G426400 [Sorghum bicolor]OQU92741.1 hypothetical protein SORBI_3001G400601 [Sorghum bicolor]
MFHQIQIQSAAGAIILCQDPLRPRSSARRRAVTSRGPSPCDLCPSPVVFFTRISFTRGSTSSCTSPSRTWGRREEGEGGAGVGNLDPRGPVGSREEGEGGVGGGHLDRRARSGGRASGRREQRRHAKRADGAAPARGASGREVRGD